MKRRQFLRAALGASAAAAGFFLNDPRQPGFRIAKAAQWNGKTLLLVYQRGGCDGLNTVVPHGYPAASVPADDSNARYYDIRPTIAIAKPGETGGAIDLPPAPGVSGSSGLGLHPAFRQTDPTLPYYSFQELYQNGNLAVMPAVHYANASRSHFSGQQFTESAQSDLGSDGWLNRYLQTSTSALVDPLRAVGIGSDLPHALRGSEIVSVFYDLRSFELGISNADDEAEVLTRLAAVYGQTPDSDRLYAQLFHDFGRVTLSDLAVVKALNNTTDLDPDTYVTGGSIPYPGGTFGRQMKQTALLIKAGVGLEIASLSIGGWDNHSSQGGAVGTHANRLGEFAGGIHALFDDLTAAGLMDDVLVLTMTEFGRTSKENGSKGTDHAHAAAWCGVGSTTTLNGGLFLGREKTTLGGDPDGSPITDWINIWDPLDPDKMVRGRYLDHTIDYRNVYGEVLEKFLGNTDYATLLPSFNYIPGPSGSGPGFLG